MIRVMIERLVAEDLAEHYDQMAGDTLQRSMRHPGFISGEALRDIANPNHRLVIATYRTLQDWQRWYGSTERRELLASITPLLDKEEKITIFEHL